MEQVQNQGDLDNSAQWGKDEEAPTPALHPMTAIGRIVQFTFGSHFNEGRGWSGINGQSRVVPAMIVQVWSDTCVNLVVFVDGVVCVAPKTSVVRLDMQPVTIEGSPVADSWQWPERS